MTNYFSKELRVSSTLTEQGKKERLLYTILSGVFFVVGGFAFWEFVYDLCNMIGAIVSGTPSQAGAQALRMLPFILIAFYLVYIGGSCYNLYMATSTEKRGKEWFKKSIVSMVWGGVIVLYVFIALCAGEYNAIVEGYVTPLFPLDALLFGLGIVGLGVAAFFYSKRLVKKGSELPVMPERQGAGTKAGKVFGTISYMMALSGFAACIYSFWVMDSAHGNVFYNIMLWLNYFVAVAMAVIYRFVYSELKAEYKKKACLELGIIVLVINAVLFILYMVAVQVQNEAPNLNAFGVLPIEFTASFNAFTVLFGLNNLLCPIIAIIKGVIKRKEN